MASCVRGTREEGPRSTPVSGEAFAAGEVEELAQAGMANRMRLTSASGRRGKVVMIGRFLAAGARGAGKLIGSVQLQVLKGDAFALSTRASPYPEPYGDGVNSDLNSGRTEIGRDRAAVEPGALFPVSRGPFCEKDGADRNRRGQGRDGGAGA